MNQHRRDTVPMSRDEINRLRLAAALDVSPDRVTADAMALAKRDSVGDDEAVSHG
jgi:hypothetical protein